MLSTMNYNRAISARSALNRAGFSRRDFLSRTAALTLAAGLWPGRLLAGDAAKGEAGDFDFIAVNDLHYVDPKLCPPWFETAFEAMKASAPKAEFVLLSGDLTMNATAKEFAGIREAFEQLKLPVHLTLGNHDVTKEGQRTLYEGYFPERVNYAVEHRGWQFFCLNSVESRAADGTKIPQETLQWLDDNLKKFEPGKPTVISTHYPLGRGVVRRPGKSDDLLKRFEKFNLQSIFNGHWHGYTQTLIGDAVVTTDRCCSRIRLNHDGSPLKGWFVCQARAGKITRRFVTVPAELMKDPGKPY
jgi:Calcineurin-like phosphoesterase